MNVATYAWRGTDDPDRLEVVRAAFGPTGCAASGASVALEYHTTWDLEIDEAWVTRSLIITRRDQAGRSLRLNLRRSSRGIWTGDYAGTDGLEQRPASLTNALSGSLDCDLGRCPFTNLMPIRRMLQQGTIGQWVGHTMAWVKVPTLEVAPATQQYMVVASDERGAQIRYRSSTSQELDLHVDRDGVVIDYPMLAERVLPPQPRRHAGPSS